VVRAKQLMSCGAPEQVRIDDPVRQARMLYEQALEAVDNARTGSSLEQQRLGAFRATTVKQLSDLLEKQANLDQRI